MNLWNDLKARIQALRHRAKTRTLFTFRAAAALRSTIAGKQDLKDTSQRIPSKKLRRRRDTHQLVCAGATSGGSEERFDPFSEGEKMFKAKRGRLRH